MTRYRDPSKLGDPRWPQTGLRVGVASVHLYLEVKEGV